MVQLKVQNKPRIKMVICFILIKNGNTTVNSKGVDGKENTKKLAEGKESLQFSYGMGYGKDSDSQSSTTKSGINTQNITIKDEAEQLKRTGKTVQEEIAAIKTEITTESAQSQKVVN